MNSKMSFRHIEDSQGSVLSFLLYTLYVMELEKNYPSGSKMLQYADDVCVYSNISQLTEGLNVIEQSLRNILEFLSTIGLTLSANKTQLCIFSKNNQALRIQGRAGLGSPGLIGLKFKIRIRNSNVIQFLGMTFQSNLSWTAHIKNVGREKCLLIENLRMFGPYMVGADPRLLLDVFRALIGSRLEYGGFLL